MFEESKLKAESYLDPELIEQAIIQIGLDHAVLFTAESKAVFEPIPKLTEAENTFVEIEQYLKALFDNSHDYLYASGLWLNELSTGKTTHKLLEPNSASKFLFISKVLDLAMTGIERLHTAISQSQKYYKYLDEPNCVRYLKLQLWYLTVNAQLQRHGFVIRAADKLKQMNELMREFLPQELCDEMYTQVLEMDFDIPSSVKSIYHALIHEEYSALLSNQHESGIDVHISITKCIEFFIRDQKLAQEQVLDIITPVTSPSPEEYGIDNPWAEKETTSILVALPPVFLPFVDQDQLQTSTQTLEEDDGLSRLSKCSPLTATILYKSKTSQPPKVAFGTGNQQISTSKTCLSPTFKIGS